MTENRILPDDWKIGDTCYLVLNKKTGYSRKYKIVDYKEPYFLIVDDKGRYDNVSPVRIHRSKEDAMATVCCITPPPMTEKQKEDFIKELEQIRGRMNAQIDNCIKAVKEGENFPDHYVDETWLSSSTHHYKGRKPAAVVLPSGEKHEVETWLEMVKIILTDCASDPARHERMQEMCGKVYGKVRTIFAPTPKGMVHPVQVGDEDMFFEGHFDTETLFNILIDRILRYAGYDFYSVRIQCKTRIKRT